VAVPLAICNACCISGYGYAQLRCWSVPAAFSSPYGCGCRGTMPVYIMAIYHALQLKWKFN